MRKVLHKMHHRGCGDTVQFQSVLRILKLIRPHQKNYVRVGVGKHGAIKDDADGFFINNDGDLFFDEVIDHDWHECYKSYDYCPSTKAAYCLDQLFKIQPIKELMYYKINVSQPVFQKVDDYIKTLPESKGIVCIHYQGNSSQKNKNISHEIIGNICNYMNGLDYTPIILDWDRRSPLPNNRTIFCPDSHHPMWGNTGTGDAETIAGLISRSKLMIGIDSSPQKIALATDTPTLCLWTQHHPINYCDPLNGIHLIPTNHEQYVRNDKGTALKYFYPNYKFHIYENLMNKLYECVGRYLEKPKVKGKIDPTGVKFFVGIPTLKRYDLLDKTINSVLNSEVKPEKIIIIDNGGNYKNDKVQIIRPNAPMCLSAAWNMLHHLTAPYPLVLMNDDLEISPNVLGNILSYKDQYKIITAQGAHWSCFYQDHSLWDLVGPYDENFKPAYFEDNDYSYRLKLAGVERLDVPHDGIFHIGSGTLNSFSLEERSIFNEKWEQSRSYYYKKWGGGPEEEVYAKPFNVSEMNSKLMSANEILFGIHARNINEKSDISQHLPTIHRLAKECKSSLVVGSASGKVIPALLIADNEINIIEDDAEDLRIYDSLSSKLSYNSEIETYDLLFIDTPPHSYTQLKKQLLLEKNIKKYIIMHDTTTFKTKADNGEEGLGRAIDEFLAFNVTWKVKHRYEHNNGLTVLERKKTSKFYC